jgi:hypothetical protein
MIAVATPSFDVMTGASFTLVTRTVIAWSSFNVPSEARTVT